MNRAVIYIVMLLLCSCHAQKDKFEKNYYERITGINLPENYDVLEAFDNGEWLTGAVLRLDHLTLSKFITENRFYTLQNVNDLHLMSNSYLRKYKAQFIDTKNIYYITKSRSRNNWTYVADLKSNILWAEISYPDWSGQ